MAQIEDVKKLRETTGVSISECQKALEEAGGDFDIALESLRSRGAQIAEKKALRETKAGIIDAYIHGGGKIGVLLELLCETDFVAKNNLFQELAHDIAMQVAATNPSGVDELLALPFIKDESKSVKDRIDETIGVLGENISVGKFSRFEL